MSENWGRNLRNTSFDTGFHICTDFLVRMVVGQRFGGLRYVWGCCRCRRHLNHISDEEGTKINQEQDLRAAKGR